MSFGFGMSSRSALIDFGDGCRVAEIKLRAAFFNHFRPDGFLQKSKIRGFKSLDNARACLSCSAIQTFFRSLTKQTFETHLFNVVFGVDLIGLLARNTTGAPYCSLSATLLAFLRNPCL